MVSSHMLLQGSCCVKQKTGWMGARVQQNRCLLMVAPEQLLASYDECSHRLGRVGEQMVLARMVAALRACSLEHHQLGELRASDIFPTG